MKAHGFSNYRRPNPPRQITLKAILQMFLLQPQTKYSFTFSKNQITLETILKKRLRSTVRNENLSKGELNLFSNMASKMKVNSCRGNRSPLRQRNNRDYQTEKKNENHTHFLGIDSVESARQDIWKQSAKSKGGQQNKEVEISFATKHQIKSDVVPHQIGLSFQNLNQNFSAEPKIQITECKRSSNLQIVAPVTPPLISPKQSEQPVKIDAISIPEEYHPTDNSYQKLKNHYAQPDYDLNSSEKPEAKSNASIKSQRVSDPLSEKEIQASHYASNNVLVAKDGNENKCRPDSSARYFGIDFGVDDLDIDGLIDIETDGLDSSPIKEIKDYRTDFNLKSYILPTESHIYEVIKDHHS